MLAEPCREIETPLVRSKVELIN